VRVSNYKSMLTQ